jgi:NAD(P)-dependent dehydrogenase (short-subunit alcohol dehydrogenase family)
MEQTAAGKIAVVTGGNRGMGLETCRQLATCGARVILTSRDPEKGEAAAGRLQGEGLDVRHHQLDVADDANIGRPAEFIRKEFGRLDILINNAGIARGRDEPRERAMRTFEASAAGLREVLATNLIGSFLLCQALIPLMQGRGRVVNVSSGMGQLCEMSAGLPAYRISKAGLNALTRIFASELEGSCIKVNAACPGWVHGRLRRAALGRARRGDDDLARDPAGRRPERRPVPRPKADPMVGPSEMRRLANSNVAFPRPRELEVELKVWKTSLSCSPRKYGLTPRAMSPPPARCSILITSAPMSAR